MKVLSFTIKKILAERIFKDFSSGYTINTDVEFTNLVKDKVEMLKADDVFNLAFKFTVGYGDGAEKDRKIDKKEASKGGEVIFEGNILLAAEKEEAKDMIKGWKKKEIPANIRFPLFNMILKKCSSRALALEEEINLPSHVPMPQLHPGQNQQS